MSTEFTPQWTPDMVTRLAELWSTGLSASQIGTELRVTKNAVLGKRMRIGLPARRQGPQPDAPKGKRVRVPSPPPMLHPLPPTPLPPRTGSIGVVDLEPHHCRWPLGLPGDPGFTFCGRNAPVQPYCTEHRLLAFYSKR